jgi:hypothetical protein
MRMILAFILSASFGNLALAKVPYNDIDALRKKTIVVRSAIDSPDQKWAKKCATLERRNFAGERLSLATDNAATQWKKLTATKADLQAVSKKVNTCEARGSCSVYEVYLGAVQIPEELNENAAKVRSQLEKKLEAMTPSSYQKALADIRQPCAVLKGVIKGK